VSTSTSSRVPTFPSTTAALRLSPRSFARFIGEFHNAVENASCDMPRMSRASVRPSFPASAARAANARSPSSDRNRTFDGQTSWQTSRYARFEVLLSTGAGTPGKRRG
jgi:hypothetical protein